MIVMSLIVDIHLHPGQSPQLQGTDRVLLHLTVILTCIFSTFNLPPLNFDLNLVISLNLWLYMYIESYT